MLGKLFKKNQPSSNVGNENSKSSKTGSTEKATYITIPKLESQPNIQLEKKVTIGSQVGDFIVDDENVAPRHCSFFINKGIISVMDHSSSTGTFINKKQLDPGKIFILSEKDKIRLGKLDLKIEYMDVPVSVATPAQSEYSEPSLDDLVDGSDEVVEEHFEDATATHTVMEVPDKKELGFEDDTGEFDTEQLAVEEPTSAGEEELNMPELEIPDLPSFEDEFEAEEPQFDKAPNLPEEATKTQVSAQTQLSEDDIDLSDVDVEEEMLDESLLPTKVREKHMEENLARAAALVEEEEPEDNEDLAGFEVTSTGIKALKLADEGKEEKTELSSDIKAALEKRRKNRKPVKARGAKAKAKRAKTPATSFLTRLFALINDILICLILLEIFYVYTDVKAVYDSLPSDIWALIEPHYNKYVIPLYTEYTKDLAIVHEIVSDLKKFVETHNVLPFMAMLFIFRMITGMILSVSLGQLIVGMRASGKFLWKRIVYPIREVLGLFTLPLLILDLPALISKRTFKEVILFSQYETPKPRFTAFSAIFITPILLVCLGISPVFKGLDIPPPVPFAEKTRPLKKWSGGKQIKVSSMQLSVYSTDTIEVLPSFRITMSKKKKRLRPGLLVLDTQTGGMLAIQKLKSFSLIDMFTSFVDMNYLAFQFQPEINSFVRDVSRKNKDFKLNKSNLLNLNVETINLVKNVNDYSLEKASDFLVENGFMLRGFRDFREKFDNIFSSKLDLVEALPLGNSKGIMGSYKTGRSTTYEFFPIGMAKSNLYGLSESVGKAPLKTIVRALQFEPESADLASTHPVAKLVNSFTDRKISLTNEEQQFIFKNYYDAVKKLLELDNMVAIKKLEKELQQALNALGINKNKNRRLYQKLNQILQAIKNDDRDFFQLTNSKKKTV